MREYCIGIDHGYGYIKTAQSIMLAGVDIFASEPPFLENVVEYEGKYYVVGESRKSYAPNKTDTIDYYILSLAAIAKELDLREKARRNIQVILATGLPLEYFGSQKKEFRHYLLQNKVVTFKFEGRGYQVAIENVVVFPQGYAVIASKIGQYTSSKVVVDIGTGTLDILPIVNRKPQLSRCESLPLGVLACIEQVQKEFRRKYNMQLDDFLIQEVMQGKKTTMDIEYLTLIKSTIKQYVENVFRTLVQKGINTKMNEIVFCGGGAAVVKRFGSFPKNTVTFIDDIYANAKGYEYLYRGMR